jgi:hypothetical protein
MTFAYERAKKEVALEPLRFTIDGEEFLCTPKLGTKVAERLHRAQRGDLGAVWEALEATFIDRATYERFIDLNLDPDEDLTNVMDGIYTMYSEEVGKSRQSEEQSMSISTPSVPTSPASTTPTLPTSGLESAGLSAV